MLGLVQKIKFQPLWLWLLFFLLTWLLYSRGLNNYFVSDDWHWLWLAKNTPLSIDIFRLNYAGGSVGGSYNPLLLLIFKYFYNLFSLNESAYHLVSLLVHSVNSLLVYLLASRIFKILSLKNIKRWSIIAALLFLVWPTHVEAVSWISAWTHLWATMLYLLALVFYFDRKFALTLLVFILALFIKEIALSLILIVVIWEFYFVSRDKRKINASLLLALSIATGAFMWLRFIATGDWLSYYASDKLDLGVSTLLANLMGYIIELITASYWREIFFKAWYHRTESVALVMAVVLVAYLYHLLIKKKFGQTTIFFSFLLALAPVLTLGLNRLTFEGERYVYLASVFWLIWLVYLMAKIRISHYWQMLFLILLFSSSISIVYQKTLAWQMSASISEQVVASYENLDISAGQSLVSVALPDNLDGAQLWRNNLQQALELNYPDNYPQIIALPIYVRLTADNIYRDLLKWRQDELGWFAESVDSSYIVTGITSITRDGYYWELWNYNYQNYTANTIRLIPQGELLKKIRSGEIRILTFDKTRLKMLY